MASLQAAAAVHDGAAALASPATNAAPVNPVLGVATVLFSSFLVVILGYAMRRSGLLVASGTSAISTVTGTVCLPILVFKSFATLDLSGITINLLLAIVIGKATGFACAAAFVALTARKSSPGQRLRKAAIYGLAACNSNDLSFGFPVVAALLPQYVPALFFANGIQSILFNPLAFVLIGLGQQKDDQAKAQAVADAVADGSTSRGSQSAAAKAPLLAAERGVDVEDGGVGGGGAASASASTRQRRAHASATTRKRMAALSKRVARASGGVPAPASEKPANPLAMQSLLVSSIRSLVTNPVVMATGLGLGVGALTHNTLPDAAIQTLTVPAEAFTFGALFSLGAGLYGQLGTLGGRNLLQPGFLVAVKLLCVPMVIHVVLTAFNSQGNEAATVVNFGWVYGLVPTSASVSVWARQYSVFPERMSGTVVICMLASAPLLFTASVLLDPNPSSVGTLMAISFTRRTLSTVSMVASAVLLGSLLASKRFRANAFPLDIVAWIGVCTIAMSVLDTFCFAPPTSHTQFMVLYVAWLVCEKARFFFGMLLAYILMRLTTRGAAAGRSIRDKRRCLYACIWVVSLVVNVTFVLCLLRGEAPPHNDYLPSCADRQNMNVPGLAQAVAFVMLLALVVLLAWAEKGARFEVPDCIQTFIATADGSSGGSARRTRRASSSGDTGEHTGLLANDSWDRGVAMTRSTSGHPTSSHRGGIATNGSKDADDLVVAASGAEASSGTTVGSWGRSASALPTPSAVSGRSAQRELNRAARALTNPEGSMVRPFGAGLRGHAWLPDEESSMDDSGPPAARTPDKLLIQLTVLWYIVMTAVSTAQLGFIIGKAQLGHGVVVQLEFLDAVLNDGLGLFMTVVFCTQHEFIVRDAYAPAWAWMRNRLRRYRRARSRPMLGARTSPTLGAAASTHAAPSMPAPAAGASLSDDPASDGSVGSSDDHLVAVAEEMAREEHGLFADREWKGDLVPRCCVARDVVAWLVENGICAGRAEGTMFGEAMVEAAILVCAAGDFEFGDQFLLFRLSVGLERGVFGVRGGVGAGDEAGAGMGEGEA